MTDPTPIVDDTETLRTFLRGISPQRLILRSVDEHRPSPLTKDGIVVSYVRYVDVVTVEKGARREQRFVGVAANVAKEIAQQAGHDVIERNGNLT